MAHPCYHDLQACLLEAVILSRDSGPSLVKSILVSERVLCEWRYISANTVGH